MPLRSNKGVTKEETNNKSINAKSSSPSPTSASNKDHHRHHHHGIIIEDGQEEKINGVSNRSRTNMNGGIYMPHPHTPLKSNLKKSTVIHEKTDQLTVEIRKVSWPDDHGKDIAHVQEFEPR